jgi:hypothetical protein
MRGHNDVFVKNASAVSFTGTSESKKTDVGEALATIGFVGGFFALTLGSAIYFVNHPSSSGLVFLSDGTYVNLSNLSAKSSNVTADADDGILQIKGTGIDIRPERFDYVDAGKGIYKNYDGSVDIDLLKHKFIDKANGIFVDPAHKISAVMHDGKLENIVVPDTSFGTSMDPRDHYISESLPITRANFMEKYGISPEEYKTEHGFIPQSRTIVPDDNRSLTEKLKDFFSGHNSNNEKLHDIFGREIVSFTDKAGNMSHVALNEEMMEFVKDHHLNNDKISELINFADNIRLKEYLVNFEPHYADLVKTETMDEFVSRLSATSSVVDINDTTFDSDVPDESDTMSDCFVDFFKSIADES